MKTFFYAIPLLCVLLSIPSKKANAQFASLPYGTGFETGTLAANWTTQSSDPLGRVQIWDDASFAAASPVTGNFHLGLDTQPPGGIFTTNEAMMGLNLAGESEVTLEFWWMEWNDETHPEDGIFFSDNGGTSFVKVLDLEGGLTTDLTWQRFVLSIDDLAAANGLSLTGNFVVKFQQHDNFYFNGGNDGFFFDNISVTSNLCSFDPPVTSDVDVCGSGPATLTASGNGGQIIWYDTPNGISPIANGSPFITPPLSSTSTYYVAEGNTSNLNWDFTTTLEGWTSIAECGLAAPKWNWAFDGGNRAAFAQDIAGNSSQFLQSPLIDVSGAATVDLSFDHRFNTETCCDHGYVVFRLDGGPWQIFTPSVGPYNIFDFMYNDPISGACGNSPDLDVFAGDNGGYQTSAGLINVISASTLEVSFLFTTDPSFGDDGWYISEVNMDLNCESQRQVVAVNVLPNQPDPTSVDASICSGSGATMTVSSNSANPAPVFDWFDLPVNGNLLATGNSFSPSPPNTTTYWVEERPGGPQTDTEWTFDNDAQGWALLTQCSLPFNWTWNSDNGRGTLFADNPSSGNSSMLAVSPGVSVNGIDEVTLSFKHRYNTETCCDHGYAVYRINGGPWQYFEPDAGQYNTYDFMYNDPIFGGCGFSPDTLTFAGDSQGYITSSGSIDVSSGAGLQVGFLYTTDASFSDEGWFIDQVRIVSTSSCPSARVPATIYVEDAPPAPTVSDLDICSGFSATLTANSNSSNPNPVFNWFDVPAGGTSVFSGNPYISDPVAPTTVYVEELANGSRNWTFDSGLEEWTTTSECGLPGNWQWVDDGGEGAIFAQQNGSGNSSMLLRSPPIQIENSDILTLTFDHRYNTETCCDHGYIVYRIDGGQWEKFEPTSGAYNIYDFMYNDPFFGDCGFSPDTLVYAGDSGGYIPSSGTIDVFGGNTLELVFFYSTDASFVDEGWYINSVSLEGIALPGCPSTRIPVNINFPTLTAPGVIEAEICPPQLGTLTASTTSGTVDPQFEWFNAPANGNLLFSGTDYTPQAPPVNTTTYYVQEILRGEKIWDFDNGPQGWQVFANCGLPSTWNIVDDNGTGSYFAQQSGSGNSSMSLRSPLLDVSRDVGNVTLSFSHRYNTETCCDHGYVIYRLDGGPWQLFEPATNGYNIFDFMYNDPFFGGCGFSPDTTVYAGDSNGYIQSSGEIDVSGAGTLQLLFFYSSDASFVDDGWYIEEVRVTDIVTSCVSTREPATLSTTGTFTGPIVDEPTICPGLNSVLDAQSTSGVAPDNMTFNWYDSPAAGNLLFTGNPFDVSPLATTTYYVEEVSSGNLIYDFDTGLDGWTATSECGLESNWQHVTDQGRTSLFAQQNGSGNSSMFLKSPVIPLNGQFAINYNFAHRYNTETCCDHGYAVVRRDGGPWFQLSPSTNPYNVFDFMYNDPIFGDCGFSPDMNVFAGDSGGYLTSSGSLFTNGFSNVEFGFLYTTDASFVDDGWYIDRFEVLNIYSGCTSDRIPVTVNVENLAAPSAPSASTCPNGSAVLTASSNSNVPNTAFEWYDAAVGGNLLYIGNPFFTAPVPAAQSFWVQEVSLNSLQLSDDFDGGFDPGIWFSVQGGTADIICGSVSGDALRFDGLGTRIASTNQIDVAGGATMSFSLKVSQELTAGCESAEPGEDIVLEYSIGGPFVTINSYNQDSYPDFTLIIESIPAAAQTANTVFRLRQLSNSGAGFDNWAIDNFSITGLSSNFCTGPRTEVPVTIQMLAAPSGQGDDICPGEPAAVTASSNSGFGNPVFEWYTAPIGGALLDVANPFMPSPVATTTYFVQERNQGDRSWNFSDGLEDWTATAECGLPFNWEWASDGGAGSAYATNPTSGNSSMQLTSAPLSVTGATSVNFSFSHRYDTETCCDHGYVVYRLDGGSWEMFVPTTNNYNIFDFMYNDPIFGGCGFSPDTTVYAGDSGGYITSAGAINTTGAQELEISFLWTSDASFRDDGWYINSAQLTGLGSGCISQRAPVTVTVGPPAAPIASATTPCVGGMATLLATATSGNINPVFEWYDQPAGGTLQHTGTAFETPPVFGPTSYYVQEIVPGIPFSLSDNFNNGFDPGIWGSVQAGQSDAVCGSVSGNALRFNGLGTRLARTNQLNVGNGGTLAFNLRISQDITAGCESAEPGEDVVLEYSVGGPYTIITTYDQDGYATFTPIIEPIPAGALGPNTIFRFRQLSNSGLDFDVWAIDNFEINATTGQFCNSSRTEVPIIPTLLPGPTADGQFICEGDMAVLTPTSNTGLVSTEFEWYDAEVGGNLLFTGSPFEPTPALTTTYYVQEVDPFVKQWTFDSDLEGWLASSACGFNNDNWMWAPDFGTGALAATNPLSGNTSQLVRSGPIDVSGTGGVEFSFDHRYNTETCCDHGYAVYRIDNGPWQMFIPDVNTYNIFDFMYNDPILGACGFSPDTTVYAGDSGGYIRSSGDIIVGGASILEVGFLYTTDPSFTDEGWFINEVSVSGLGIGCVTERTPVEVTVRPCCVPLATFNYVANNTTAILTDYCYLNPNDNFFHFYNPATPFSLLFTVENVDPTPGSTPVAIIEHVGGPTQNTPDPANCNPGPLAPDQFFELERSWDVQLNGAEVGPGGARVRFYYPTVESGDLQTLVDNFLLNFAACQYAVEETEWFKSANGTIYTQGEYDGTQLQLNTFDNATYGTVSNNIHYVELNTPGFSGGALGVQVRPIGNPLAVELLDFSAEKYTDRSSLLKWHTVTEINNSYFGVEHSADGINFTEIGQVAGAGSTTLQQNYDFVDESPIHGNNFYRLRIVDTDNSFTYSEIKVVNFQFEFTMGVRPNPFIHDFDISITSEVEREAVLRVYDILGRMVESRNVTLIPGNNNFYFDASGSPWAAGVYIVDMRTSLDEHVYIKVVKAE